MQGTPKPLQFWLDLLEHPSRRARHSAMGHLAFIDCLTDEEAQSGSCRRWYASLRLDPDDEIRHGASWALMEIALDGPGIVAALIEAMRGDHAGIRWYAVIALHHIGPSAASALPVLVEALGDPNPALRGWAAEAIGRLGPEAAREPLIAAGWPPESWPEAMGEADPHIRILVATALGGMGPAGVSPLIEMLADGHPEVRRAASASLVVLGSDAEKAFVRAVGHADPTVRFFAAVAAPVSDMGRRGLPNADRPAG